MAKASAFMWYPKDCDTDEHVKGMDDAEFGFYVRCLNHAWLNNGLPVEISEFARMMRKTPKQFIKLWARVSRCFFENSEKRFVNFRQEQQRAEQESFRKSRVEAAKSMHANKSSLHVHPKTDAQDMHVQCSAFASTLATAIPTKNKEDQEHIAPAVAEAPLALAPPPLKIVRKKSKTAFPMESIPAEWVQGALDSYGWNSVKAETVFDAFMNHHKAHGSLMADWIAAWRKWCGNENKFARAPTNGGSLFEGHTARAIRIGNERIRETGRL